MLELEIGDWRWSREDRNTGRTESPPKAYCNNPNEIKCTVNISNYECYSNFKVLVCHSNNNAKRYA